MGMGGSSLQHNWIMYLRGNGDFSSRPFPGNRTRTDLSRSHTVGTERQTSLSHVIAPMLVFNSYCLGSWHLALADIARVRVESVEEKIKFVAQGIPATGFKCT